MRLNNKGFAASIILYSAVAVVLIVMLSILTIYATNTHNKTDQADDIKRNISKIELGNE